MRKIVALTGQRCSGKTTQAKLLEAEGYTRLSFADPIRDLVNLLETDNGNEWHRRILIRDKIDQWLSIVYSSKIDKGILFKIVTEATELTPQPGKSINRLQYIGQEAKKRIDESLWADILYNRVKRYLKEENIVIDDLRFLVEQAVLDKLIAEGEQVVVFRLWRGDQELETLRRKYPGITDEELFHCAEQEIRWLRCDIVVGNPLGTQDKEVVFKTIMSELDRWFPGLEKEDELTGLAKEIFTALHKVIRQIHSNGESDFEVTEEDYLSSGCIGCNADALRLLAGYGKAEIVGEDDGGRNITIKWLDN